MTYQICEWVSGEQITRDATPEEVAEIEARIAAAAVEAAAAAAAEMTDYLTEVRAVREGVLNRISGIGLAALFSENTSLVTAVLAARTALLNITTAPGVVDATNFTELKTAIVAAQLAIVAAAPSELRTAFTQPDS